MKLTKPALAIESFVVGVIRRILGTGPGPLSLGLGPSRIKSCPVAPRLLKGKAWEQPLPPAPPPRPLLTVRLDDLARDPTAIRALLWQAVLHAGPFQLAKTHRTAWLLVTYDAAILTGGHGQYFSDFGVGVAAETRRTCRELRLEAHRLILNQAIERHLGTPGETDCVEIPARLAPYERPDYSDLDAAYLSARDRVHEALAGYLASHQSDFLLVLG